MPIYEYTCQACDKTFDHLARRMSDTAAACPDCGSEHTKRALSLFAVAADTARDAEPAPTRCGCGNLPGSRQRG